MTQNLQDDIELKAKEGLFFPDQFLLHSHSIPKSVVAVACDALSMSMGSYVQVTGERGQHGGSLVADRLIVYKVDIQRKFSSSWKPAELTGAALLEEQPQVSRTDPGRSETLWLDGYPIRIPRNTERLTFPEVERMPIGSFLMTFDLAAGSPTLAHASALPATLFQPNIWVAYQAARRADGHALLGRARLWPSQLLPGCESVLAKMPTIQVPDYSSHISGSATFPKVTRPAHKSVDADVLGNRTLSIIPDRLIQDYVSKLGTTLIPQYQATMPETSDAKVHFRFYVVRATAATFDSMVNNIYSVGSNLWLARPSWDDAVLALPNGTLYIPVTTLIGVESEAQLAAILSSAIASVLQGQSCVASYESSRHRDSAGLSGDISSFESFTFGFVLWRNEQALRIGIRHMYLAGYDIREAPFAWAAAQGKPVNNPVIDSKHPDKEIPWYAAYAFDYISKYYSDVDYSKLKRGEVEYQDFLKELRVADPEAFAGQP